MIKYNLIIKYKPGIHNHADALSRCPDYNKHTPPDEEIGLSAHLFINNISALDLNDTIQTAQDNNHTLIQYLQQHYPIMKTTQGWTLTNQLVVVGNNDLRRGVISSYHNFPTAGHPGGQKTLVTIAQDYWWPNLRKDVIQFIKGCATCQFTKSRTIQAKPPLYPIGTQLNTLPFETITLDFITKLPLSQSHATILSITNQGCSKATIFLPCKETIDALGVAKIYAKHVFPHYSILKKVISDRDT